jgi:hypothetical protein
VLGLLLDKDLELILEVHDLQEVALDLLAFLQGLLHPLGIHTTLLVLTRDVLSFPELGGDLGDFQFSL